jgi:hypothetical protein
MMSFIQIYKEVSRPNILRKGFHHKRKEQFSISNERINELYDRYFSNLSPRQKQFTFQVLPKDLGEILYLLRVYFQLWIEIQEHIIIINSDFPKQFRLTKEVNSNNHWYTPKTLPQGTILYYGEDHYGVCNRSNGIPLSEMPPNKELNLYQPVVQINYDFIEVVDDLF